MSWSRRVQLTAAAALSLAFSPQSQGRVSSLTATADPGGGAVQITVRGTNPCRMVHLDFGDHTVTMNAIRDLPATVSHQYARAGNFLVYATGMENCGGEATTMVSVSRVTPSRPDPQRPDPPAPQRTPPYPPTHRIRFAEMDQNGDGVITRDEWRGNSKSFTEHDWNGDGRLSGDEVRPDKVTILVSSREAWTDTGIDVRAGEVLNIDAKGKIKFGRKAGDDAGPDGKPGRLPPGPAPLPRIKHGALIARVGNSAPFQAETKKKGIPAPASGRLYLGINDDNLDDNSGEFRVTVSIKAEKAPKGSKGGR